MRTGGPKVAGIGDACESRAADVLARRGYRIVARNVRAGGGEIDLVARDGDELCFVEVRGRRTRRFGAPEETVGTRKRAMLRRAAEAYLAAHPGAAESGCRFDIVAITPDGVVILKDAF
jgi:putative endonuclease